MDSRAPGDGRITEYIRTRADDYTDSRRAAARAPKYRPRSKAERQAALAAERVRREAAVLDHLDGVQEAYAVEIADAMQWPQQTLTREQRYRAVAFILRRLQHAGIVKSRLARATEYDGRSYARRYYRRAR